ncbi:unnamed protein product [Arctia plantaginis]|uniref:Leucine-rich repeat-containing protein 71 n=1 Tax=Arctia plantaginis TaxID=874455 RepID=A0A8S0ZMU2_ARCPL|nr:unnamed protein product [Arctia plantaginis]
MEKYGSATMNFSKTDQKPLPTNFDEFIPWACRALQESFYPIITRSTQHTLDTSTTKGKKDKTLENELNDIESEFSDKETGSDDYYNNMNNINIEAVYDSNNLLHQLKFIKNNKVPRHLLKLISLITRFHPQLTGININKGLNHEGLYEISKMVASSFITEVILDGTIIKEGNFYLLVEKKSYLKYLSLARCNINDTILKELTARLIHPLPMSRVLSVLNLSSNKITNNGAKYLGEMLETNRQLAYLNLAGNMISDTGAESIMNSLVEFPLSIDNIIASKTRKYNYLKEKNNLVKKTVEEMLYIELNKMSSKSKSDQKGPAFMRKQKESRIRESTLRYKHREESYAELAESAVNAQMGPFMDPYSSENLISRNGTLYCLGNNILCYLSLAYNDLTNLSVKKLYSVLNTQHNLNRTPRGLVNVCIDGNDMTDSDPDLAKIDLIIDRGLTAELPVVTTTSKKKGGSTK